MVTSFERAGALDRVNVFRFGDHANRGGIAPLVAAKLARVALRKRVTDRTEANVVFNCDDCFGETLCLVARPIQQMKYQPSCGLRANRRQLAELVDERGDWTGSLAELRHINPGIFIPPVTAAIRFCEVSLALPRASFTATAMRSSSVSTSSGSTASLPMRTRVTRWSQVTSTVTAPPAALPLTTVVANSSCAFCISACIFLNCASK